MTKVVFDIETLGYPVDHFDPVAERYLFKFATTDQERTETIQKFALTAVTGYVIAIAMLNPDTRQGKVFYQSDESSTTMSDDGRIAFIPGDETALLTGFWEAIPHFSQFVTFNGRSFDCPFLMLRSAMLGVTPTRNLMPYRYSHDQHIDLLEQLTFYGVGRKFTLDLYCKSFGIESPKAAGITGHDMAPMFAEKRYHEIAEYCMRDVRATTELYERWEHFLRFER